MNNARSCFQRDHVEEGECHSVGKGEPTKCREDIMSPKPMMLFMM